MVRAHRERLGISITDLARATLMDQGLLSKIERGVRPPPQLIPHVQRIAEHFRLAPESSEHRELFDTAYEERFGRKPRGPVLIELSRATTPSRGLSGLPPEYTAPDSSPAQYYRSKGLEVGQRLDTAGARKAAPPSVPHAPSGAPPVSAFPWSQLIALVASTGVDVVSFQKAINEKNRVLRVNAVLQFPDGSTFEVKALARPQRTPGKPRQKKKSGRRRLRG